MGYSVKELRTNRDVYLHRSRRGPVYYFSFDPIDSVELPPGYYVIYCRTGWPYLSKSPVVNLNKKKDMMAIRRKIRRRRFYDKNPDHW